jgi:hypothetical protein
MPNRAWLERLVLFLAAYTGRPVVLTSQKGGTFHIRDVRNDGHQITIYLQADK